jgi:glycosyltransferase involved in cell wall biosynthesis
MEKQISIIIPTYNMERYIGKCLDSLLIPEIDAVEVLVVNDGSKDRSSEIAHGYADRYPQSIKVIDKANGNYGSCINAALPIATGRYVKVLDADDTFDTTAFSEFVRLLPSLSDDVLITPFCIVNEAGEVTQITEYSSQPNVELNKSISFNSLFGSESSNFFSIQMHAITYNRSIFNRFVYHQTEGISFTDTEWTTWPFSYAKTVRFISVTPLYKYLIGREGQTVDPAQFEKQIHHYITLFKSAVDQFSILHGSGQTIPFVKYRLTLLLSSVYQTGIAKGSTQINSLIAEFDKQLRSDAPTLYNALNNSTISHYSKFSLIDEWRKKGYPVTISVPFSVRLGISIRYRLSKLFNTKK